ncbi:HET-domain-containing protein [Curvularia clavata]|uniref:HET-domain-containing protein n=1 Tax=Curvularia clavata TaxID=95742 RepID=A0A9Q8Z4A2_CURCL|nr:HET-domain-containing protein [Curvularia clavata]
MFERYPGTLPLTRDEIRLIRLLPGTWTDGIQCELVYDTLKNVRPYHALSYVWGSSKKTKRILLDAHPFAVTVNLESTLRNLRSQTQDTLLWVDALCINQADDLERTHQVNLMGSIYRSSKGVLIYLGDGIGRREYCQSSKLDSTAPRTTVFSNTSEDMPHIERFMQPNALHASATLEDGESDKRMQNTVNVFSFIRTLAWVEHMVDIPWLVSNNDDPDIEKALLHMFESLRRFMHAPFTPWWGRIWVVQEVVLAPKVTVVCGTVSAPWTMFAQAASQCLHHLHHCCSEKMEHLPRDLLNVLEDFGERIVDIDNLRKTFLEETTQTSSETAILEPRDCSSPDQRSLVSLLRRFRGRKASDPRDKVYALLGLVQPSSHRPPLIPDYSLSSAEVYRLAALESMYSSASLSVLTIDVARKYRQDLPTWVPDWEAPGDYGYNTRIDAMGIYDACVEYPVDPSTVTARCKALTIDGLYLDNVRDCGVVMLSDGSETFRETMKQWVSLKRRFGVISDPGDTDKALWRVFCADVMFSHPQITESGEIFRQTKDKDELMFVTWALKSKRSPFFDRKIPLRDYISATAIQWMQIIDFESAVLEGKSEDIGREFFLCFPEEKERKSIINDAISKRCSDQGQSGVSQEDWSRLVEYATLTLPETEALDWREQVKDAVASDQSWDKFLIRRNDLRESMQNRLRAWKEVPWMHVLDLGRPKLLQNLGRASKIDRIPYDVQISVVDRSIVSATKARRFFITWEGHVGLGPADLKKGDALCLLKGGRTPFILRSSDYQNLFCNNKTCSPGDLRV